MNSNAKKNHQNFGRQPIKIDKLLPVQEKLPKKHKEISVNETNNIMKVTQINQPNMRPTLNSRGNYVRRTVCGSPDQLIHTTFEKESKDPKSNFMAMRTKILQGNDPYFNSRPTNRLDIRKLA